MKPADTVHLPQNNSAFDTALLSSGSVEHDAEGDPDEARRSLSLRRQSFHSA